MHELPANIWEKWTQQQYDPIRQAVLIFGGSLRKEALVCSFPDVQISFQEGETTNILKGVLYMTTKRIVYLPKNTIPHNQIIHCTFNTLRCLRGTRNDLSISISDNSSGYATFKFPTAKSLFQCFNTMRKIAEGTRIHEKEFIDLVYSIVTSPNLDETPFASIEFDLSETDQSSTPELTAPKKIVHEEVPDDPQAEEIIELLAPIQKFAEFVNSKSFDMHLKLHILFYVSLITFALKIIPFFPLTALVIIGIQLFHGWFKLKQDRDDDEDSDTEDNKWKGHQAEGYYIVSSFFEDWFAWRDPKKSLYLFQACLVVFIGWVLFPMWFYVLLMLITCAVFVVKPLVQRDVIRRLIGGFWFSN